MKGKLKICHISDTHNRHKQIKWPIDPGEMDVIVHSGDMSAMGRKSEIQDFFKWFKEIPVKFKILIAGNHDKCFDPQVGEWDNFLMPQWLYKEIYEFENAPWGEDGFSTYLENDGCVINDVSFWASPITPTFGRSWGFNRDRGEKIAEYWKDIPRGTDVVITHGPAYGFVDWGEQANGPLGCEDLRRAIKGVKPLLHLSGHIHEAQGYAYDADTHYFNGCVCNLYGYEPVNAPWFIEADFEEREIKILNDVKGKEDTSSKDSTLEEPTASSGGEL